MDRIVTAALSETTLECDVCEGVDTCVVIPAVDVVEGCRPTNVCEACVKRMQAAFDAHRAAQVEALAAYAARCQAMLMEFRAFVWHAHHGSDPKIPPRLDDVDKLIKQNTPTSRRKYP